VAVERGERRLLQGVGEHPGLDQAVPVQHLQAGSPPGSIGVLRVRRGKAVLRGEEPCPAHRADPAQPLLLLPELHAPDRRPVLPDASHVPPHHRRPCHTGRSVDVGYPVDAERGTGSRRYVGSLAPLFASTRAGPPSHTSPAFATEDASVSHTTRSDFVFFAHFSVEL
jgi:hypothetical protein